jgi:putative addiction module CopG family antidote
MQVHISDEAAAAIERLVNDGSYEDASDAVESAIRLLTESSEEYIEDVRAKILKSIESLDAGRGTLLTKEVAEKIKREGRERLEARRQAN